MIRALSDIAGFLLTVLIALVEAGAVLAFAVALIFVLAILVGAI